MIWGVKRLHCHWQFSDSRSGIPLALQNKAIRSGVPIGPFQTKRKRKLRGASQDAASSSGGGTGSGKARKRASLSGTGVAGTKKGDLEVIQPGMRIWIRSDPLIFGPPDQDPVLFSLDPDPTWNN